MALLPESPTYLPLSCLTIGTRHSYWVFTKPKLVLMQASAWRVTTRVTLSRGPICLISRSTPSYTHLNTALSNQRFCNSSPTSNVGFVKLTSVWYGRRVFRSILSSAAVCPAGFLRFFGRFLLSVGRCILFRQCWFLPTVSLCWSCLPMIRVYHRSLTNCGCQYASQFGSFHHRLYS
jgi:hypothetical protein